MLFPTVEFGIFFPIVFALSWLLMPRPRLWKPFIVAASYLFYAAANWKFCFLIAAITLGNQAAAVLIHRSRSDRTRKRIMATAVVLDVLTLGVFKYYAFFVTDINDVLGVVSLDAPLPLMQIALPIGVSFFTFQAISYVVDVHRRIIEPSTTFNLAIYLSFFPHLVAGPIVRAREFLPQLDTPRRTDDVALGLGVWLIGLGLVKKVVIADYLARSTVDPVFGVPEAYAGPDTWLALYAYTAQIYCDFSGYTDMAIGLALLMGFVFPQNFDRPYSAKSFQEFWRRWHMTLSRFLRDFIYIPLGGSRGSRVFTARNIMATMLIGGLWHGAAWTFVIWGGFHGAAQVVEREWKARSRRRPPSWLAWALTFHLVAFAWVLFRAQDMSTVGAFFSQLVEPGAATLWAPATIVAVVAVIGLQLVPQRPLEAIRTWFEQLGVPALGAALTAIILLVAASIPSQGVPPFIYFQF